MCRPLLKVVSGDESFLLNNNNNKRSLIISSTSLSSSSSPVVVSDDEYSSDCTADDDDDELSAVHNNTNKRRRVTTTTTTTVKKRVTFDLNETIVHERYVSHEDISNAWLSKSDYLAIRSSVSATLKAYRSAASTANKEGATSLDSTTSCIDMRGIEKYATDKISNDLTNRRSIHRQMSIFQYQLYNEYNQQLIQCCRMDNNSEEYEVASTNAKQILMMITINQTSLDQFATEETKKVINVAKKDTQEATKVYNQ